MLIPVVCLVASLSPLLIPVRLLATPPVRSPLQTIKLLHKALREGDSATVDSLLHPDYHGISLQGARDQRHIYIATREKAVSDVAGLKPGDWDVRFLSTSTQIDPNGMAHVWARYVFYFKGVTESLWLRVLYLVSRRRRMEGRQLCRYRQSTQWQQRGRCLPGYWTLILTDLSSRPRTRQTMRVGVERPNISLRFNSKIRTLRNPGRQ